MPVENVLEGTGTNWLLYNIKPCILNVDMKDYAREKWSGRQKKAFKRR
jgi:hypothetical protein